MADNINETKQLNTEENTGKIQNLKETDIPGEEQLPHKEETGGEEPVNPMEEKDGEDHEVRPVDNPKAVIGAVLFSVGNSVEYKKLAGVLGRDTEETKKLVAELKDEYDSNADCGFTIIELEESVQMCSKASMYEHLIKIAKVPKSYSLTDSMLETLSIIAYKQPVTKLEIEKIRGVSCDHAVNKLVEYGLVTELGRLQAPGRPLLFGTTEEFLRSFNVTSLDDLPTVSPDRIEEFKKEAAEEVSLKLDI